MKSANAAAAWIELGLLIPALLFLAALFLREVQPLLGTGHIVAWYARHTLIGLFICLVSLPLTALVTGGATLAAGGVLIVVALHLATE